MCNAAMDLMRSSSNYPAYVDKIIFSTNPMRTKDSKILIYSTFTESVPQEAQQNFYTISHMNNSCFQW